MISRTSGPGTSHIQKPPSVARSAIPTWQKQLVEAVKTVDELLSILGLCESDVRVSKIAGREFPLRVPRSFITRMRPGDPRDPLLLQVLPTAREEEVIPGFGSDPLAESRATPVPGLLHKYRGRALLITTGSCAIHCRYCFRRHFPYSEHRPQGYRAAMEYLRSTPEIDEVILSGGDPLAMSDRNLSELAAELETIPHLQRLRIHSRLPVVLPSRVDEHLLQWLTGGRLAPILVIHANHPREIDAEVAAALGRLREAGIVLLNQTVLLRGVNDSSRDLSDLSKNLFAAGVLPYYLHLVDRVRGAAHFEVHEDEARALVRKLLQELPGYLVPRLVREIPGASTKVPIDLGGGVSSPSFS